MRDRRRFDMSPIAILRPIAGRNFDDITLAISARNHCRIVPSMVNGIFLYRAAGRKPITLLAYASENW